MCWSMWIPAPLPGWLEASSARVHVARECCYVPFDSHLRPGGVIDVANDMAPKTRQSFYEIAAAVAEHFTNTTQGLRDQRPL